MKHKLGFTLIELILYLGLVSLIVSATILFTWDIIYGRVKSLTIQRVTQNLRLANTRLTYEIRNASKIQYLNATDICLANTDMTHNPTRIYLNSGVLRIGWGGGSADCTSLTHNEALSDNFVNVQVTFTNLSIDETSWHIGFTLAMESTNPVDRNEYKFAKTFTSSAELRSN